MDSQVKAHIMERGEEFSNSAGWFYFYMLLGLKAYRSESIGRYLETETLRFVPQSIGPQSARLQHTNLQTGVPSECFMRTASIVRHC